MANDDSWPPNIWFHITKEDVESRASFPVLVPKGPEPQTCRRWLLDIPRSSARSCERESVEECSKHFIVRDKVPVWFGLCLFDAACKDAAVADELEAQPYEVDPLWEDALTCTMPSTCFGLLPVCLRGSVCPSPTNLWYSLEESSQIGASLVIPRLCLSKREEIMFWKLPRPWEWANTSTQDVQRLMIGWPVLPIGESESSRPHVNWGLHGVFSAASQKSSNGGAGCLFSEQCAKSWLQRAQKPEEIVSRGGSGHWCLASPHEGTEICEVGVPRASCRSCLMRDDPSPFKRDYVHLLICQDESESELHNNLVTSFLRKSLNCCNCMAFDLSEN